MLETSERARKSAEAELHEAVDRVSELNAQVASLNSSKRKLQNDCQAMTVDLEDQATELRAAEEVSKRAMSDAALVAEEVRQQKAHAESLEKMKKTVEDQASSIHE